MFESDVLSDVCFGPMNQGMTREQAEEEARKALHHVGFKEENFDKSPFELSGGQKKRVAIAGVLAMNPKILILDDSASALDFATDAALRKAIKEETHGMTVFIVSQRAASVQRADHILVLDDGKLVGDAPHAELLRSCEVYKEICLSQLSKEEVAKTL